MLYIILALSNYCDLLLLLIVLFIMIMQERETTSEEISVFILYGSCCFLFSLLSFLSLSLSYLL